MHLNICYSYTGLSQVEASCGEVQKLSVNCFSVKMLLGTCLGCFLVAIAAPVVYCQNSIDAAIENVFGGGNGSLLRDYEVVTKAPLVSLGAIEKCGGGADAGIHRCVPYYDCNPISNIIDEIEPPENGFGLLDTR